MHNLVQTINSINVLLFVAGVYEQVWRFLCSSAVISDFGEGLGLYGIRTSGVCEGTLGECVEMCPASDPDKPVTAFLPLDACAYTNGLHSPECVAAWWPLMSM